MRRIPTNPDPTVHQCVAFAGNSCIASGPLTDVAAEARKCMKLDPETMILVLDALTSEPVEVDFRGTPREVVERLVATWGAAAQSDEPAGVEAPGAPAAGRAPGRPKLGVVAREVTLLPRHWDWLGEQPGGASVTLRKLVEEARRSTEGDVAKRRAQEACYRFMNTLAGDEPGFEEALRALYAEERVCFEALTESWPVDVRFHARRLAEHAFPEA
jgi:uncharacterized protein